LRNCYEIMREEKRGPPTSSSTRLTQDLPDRTPPQFFSHLNNLPFVLNPELDRGGGGGALFSSSFD